MQVAVMTQRRLQLLRLGDCQGPLPQQGRACRYAQVTYRILLAAARTELRRKQSMRRGAGRLSGPASAGALGSGSSKFPL